MGKNGGRGSEEKRGLEGSTERPQSTEKRVPVWVSALKDCFFFFFSFCVSLPSKDELKVERREELTVFSLLAGRFSSFPEGSFLEKWVDECINDPRDKPLFNMLMNTCCISVPLLISLFLFAPNNKWGHLFGLGYFLTHYVLFLHSYILALHYSSHRTLMKKGSSLQWFNNVAPFVLCPMFGIPSGMYYLHHIIMHHCHDNCIPYDVSSTEPYQRDNLFHFSIYWFKFWATIWVELPFFAFRTKLYKLGLQSIMYQVIYFSYMYHTFRYNPVVATWGIIVPFFFTQFMLAYGNFGQHQFVEGGKPSNFRSTYNCIDCYDNTKSFQDGYHVLHHNNSRLHWSQFPETFMKQLDRMNQEKAMTFANIGFFEATALVFLGKLDVLADKAVTPWDVSKEELIEIMKERLKPISQTAAQRVKHFKEKSKAS